MTVCCTRGAFRRNEPQIQVRASLQAQDGMVRGVEDPHRFDAPPGEDPEQPVGPGRSGRQAHAQAAQPIEGSRHPSMVHCARIEGRLERAGKGPAVPRSEPVAHGDDDVGVGTQRLPGRPEVALRRARTAAKRRLAIDGEQRKVRAGWLELQRSVEDQHLRARGREVHRGLPGGSHDDAPLTEARGGLEGLIAHGAHVVSGGDEASARRGARAERMPHVDCPQPQPHEVRRARDGERGLARPSERGAAHAEHPDARWNAQRPRHLHDRGPEPRTQPRQRIPGRGASLQPRGDSPERPVVHAPTLRQKKGRDWRYPLESMLDAFALADWQLQRDAQRTRRLTGLYEHKLERMTQSPLAFLRGAAPLFYEMIERDRSLGEGPAGDGWIIGDLHVENFGAYRPSERDGKHSVSKDAVTFDVNDFDDCAIGPWRLDVLRLTTSLLLAAPLLGFRGVSALELADALVGAYAEHAKAPRPLPREPATVTALLRQVATRTKKRLLDDRTRVANGERHFVRGPRYRELPADVARAVPEAFGAYARALSLDASADELTIVDSAFRVAGTGSLGKLRVAVLTRGKGGLTGHWIFDMKEQGEPACAHLLRLTKMNGAERVATGLRTCLSKPPPLLGTTRLTGLPMVVRRLAPQEDKLSLAHLEAPELAAVVRYLGAILGRLHRRGAPAKRPAAWSGSDRARMVTTAVRMAGLHEAVFLALCERRRTASPA